MQQQQQQPSPYTLPSQYSVPSRQQHHSPTPPPVPPKPSNQLPSPAPVVNNHPINNNDNPRPTLTPRIPQLLATSPLESPPVPPPPQRSLQGDPNYDIPPRRPSRPSSTSSWSSNEASASTSSRIAPSTPRKRLFVKGKMSPRPLPSPRRTLDRDSRERERQRDRKRTPQPAAVERPPTIWTTLGHILAPVRFILAPVRVLLGPLWWHLVNTILLVLLLVGVLWFVFNYVQRSLSSLGSTVSTNVAMIPIRALATPACLLTNSMCTLSLFASNGTAQPIWKLFQGSASPEVDVAAVSRELSREARNAKDIFESLTALGDGRMTAGLGHLRIHELGIAIQTGSTLEERLFIGQDLIELANVASDLTDEIVQINAMSVNVFNWLFWEFQNIADLLALPAPQRPTPQRLGARLDSLINRLDTELDRLYSQVDVAIPIATRGKDKGWMLISQLAEVHSSLKDEKDRFPGWQKAVDVSRRFIVGGDRSKLMRINNDLEITRGTISGIDETSKSLDRVRIDLKAFRTQVRAFKGSVMGLHLGASEEIGLGPEQEMSILVGVVNDLGAAVGRAKRRPMEADRGIDA